MFILSSKKAFTLVEVITVVIIITILTTVGFVGYTGYVKSSRDSVRLTDLVAFLNRMKEVK